MVVCVRALWAIAWEFVGRNGRLNGRQVGGRGRVSSSQQEGVRQTKAEMRRTRIGMGDMQTTKKPERCC
jgi:hypothetical protein